MKIIINLTPRQRETLRPIFDKAKGTTLSTDFVGVLGQAWADGPNAGTADFHFLNPEQFKIVHRAIMRALKLNQQR